MLFVIGRSIVARRIDKLQLFHLMRHDMPFAGIPLTGSDDGSNFYWTPILINHDDYWGEQLISCGGAMI